jgi:UDP-glucuronate 4-epimerase
MRALITGAAGFVGSHLVERLLSEGAEVIGIDNFDTFYSRAFKEENLSSAFKSDGFQFFETDILDSTALDELPSNLDVIVHLAAKAGVRPSIENPIAYQSVNVAGTQNVLEFARRRGIGQFVFASSSSVYGVNPNTPWREDDHVLLPISPYASTKISGELLGHVYSHLFGIRFIALRFFTVYGPRQRPDLAIRKFAECILSGRSITVFGDGSMGRDYTYVDDIINGIVASVNYKDSLYQVINLGNSRPITVLEMIRTLEESLDQRAELDFKPEQPGDVPLTCANIEKAGKLLGYQPATPFKKGIALFTEWIQSAQLHSV